MRMKIDVDVPGSRSYERTADAAAVIHGELKQLTPRYWQPGLAGEVANLASQTAAIAVVVISGSGSRRVLRIHLTFALYVREWLQREGVIMVTKNNRCL
jgi:hypothetical protein